MTVSKDIKMRLCWKASHWQFRLVKLVYEERVKTWDSLKPSFRGNSAHPNSLLDESKNKF